MRSRFMTGAPLVLAAVIAIGCAGAGGSSAGGGPRPDRNTITAADLASAQYATIYDLVRATHSDWLINRASGEFTPTQTIAGSRGSATVTTSAPTYTGSTDVQVFVNGQHAGGVDVLKQFSPAQVSQVRYYSATQAEAKFGTGYLNGVIELSTR